MLFLFCAFLELMGKDVRIRQGLMVAGVINITVGGYTVLKFCLLFRLHKKGWEASTARVQHTIVYSYCTVEISSISYLDLYINLQSSLLNPATNNGFPLQKAVDASDS
jgi:hypothetical protein